MAYNPENPNGQATMANSEPVVIASDQTVIPVSDNSGSLTVDNANLDVALSTRLKPADTLTKVGTVDTITNVVHVDDNSGSLTVDGSVTADTELTTADLDTGAGTDTRAVVGLVGAKSGGGVLIPGDATKGLAVDLSATGANGTAIKVDNSGVTQPVSGTVTVQQGTASSLKVDLSGTGANSTAVKVDNSAVTQPVDGATAQGSSIANAPITVGGRAATTSITSVSDGQVVNAMFSKQGALVVHHMIRELLGQQQTSISSSTSETTIVTADATYLLDLYGLILTNTSSTYTKVTIKDATTGTTRMVLSVPAQETRGFMLPASDGHKQATANNNWTATCGTSVATLEVTAFYAKRL